MVGGSGALPHPHFPSVGPWAAGGGVAPRRRTRRRRAHPQPHASGSARLRPTDDGPARRHERHHSDAGYDLSDPKLSQQQRDLLEFPPFFYDEERKADGEVVRTNGAKLRWPDVCSVPGAGL